MSHLSPLGESNDTSIFPLACRKPLPLYRLQTYPPGIPDLCQGKWDPALKQELAESPIGKDAKAFWSIGKEDEASR